MMFLSLCLTVLYQQDTSYSFGVYSDYYWWSEDKKWSSGKFRVLYRNLPGGTEKGHEYLSTAWLTRDLSNLTKECYLMQCTIQYQAVAMDGNIYHSLSNSDTESSTGTPSTWCSIIVFEWGAWSHYIRIPHKMLSFLSGVEFGIWCLQWESFPFASTQVRLKQNYLPKWKPAGVENNLEADRLNPELACTQNKWYTILTY